MPQIVTIRVVRSRKIQPEQFGSAGAEVELTGNVLEGEDHNVVARQMLADSRALVYENLGLQLPARAVAQAEAADTVSVEVETDDERAEKEEKAKADKKTGTGKRRGRPPGSKNTLPKKGTVKKDEADEIPDDNIRTTPEDRKDPNEELDIPDLDETPAAKEKEGESKASETQDDVDDENFTATDLHEFIKASITNGNLQVPQVKLMQSEMAVALGKSENEIARISELKTPELVNKAKAILDEFIKENTG